MLGVRVQCLLLLGVSLYVILFVKSATAKYDLRLRRYLPPVPCRFVPAVLRVLVICLCMYFEVCEVVHEVLDLGVSISPGQKKNKIEYVNKLFFNGFTTNSLLGQNKYKW